MSGERSTIPEWMADPIVYHYTTVEALLSIVQFSVFWATHIHYMNDTTEQNVLWDLLRETAKSRLENSADSDWSAKVLRAAEDHRQRDVFAVCFSKDGGDRLSQWRGYSKGRGVSIGFNTVLLQQYCEVFSDRWRSSAPEGSHGGAILLPVIYLGQSESEAHLDKVVNSFLTPGPSWGDDPSDRLCDNVSFFAANTKHLAFVEEKEWRIMMFDHAVPQPMKFRTRGSLIVPYREFDFQPSIIPAIERIIVGPGPHQKENRESIKRLTGLSDDQIVLSDTPYRDW